MTVLVGKETSIAVMVAYAPLPHEKRSGKRDAYDPGAGCESVGLYLPSWIAETGAGLFFWVVCYYCVGGWAGGRLWRLFPSC